MFDAAKLLGFGQPNKLSTLMMVNDLLKFVKTHL